MKNSFHDQLSELLARGIPAARSVASRKFVVYGAGNFGRLVGKSIEAGGGEILYFIDAKKKENFPWPVFPLDRIPSERNAELVMGIFNAYVDILPICDSLREAGFREISTPVEFFQRIENQSPSSQYWLAPVSLYFQHRDEIGECLEYFADDASRKLYVDLWRYRIIGNAGSLPPPSPVELQYFPADVPPWRLPLRLIDCGAYTGDTLHFIRSKNIPIEAVAAFEPDPENYKKLVASFGSSFPSQEIFLSPCGVFSGATQLKFNAGGGSGSAISDSGNVTIQCISIDECLPSFRPNLIKMDIEGAEIEALIGAANTIRRYRPGLAISLYHTPHHIWQIPKLIHEWDLSYKFYLRTHLYQEFETVLYALPQ